MSILKMVNERGTNLQRLYDKNDYLTANSKTDHGNLVGSSNCVSHFTVEEMLAVKKLSHKTGGRMWVEVVLSFTPEDVKRPDTVYMSLAKDFVDLFREYQTLFAVHRDSRIRHLHVMINTVSIRDGRKFSQSPSGLQRLKQQTNDIIQRYGFDLIKIGSSEMLDLTDYSESEGFEYLEVDEPKVLCPDEINVMAEQIDIREAEPIYLDYHVYTYPGEGEWNIMEIMKNETNYTPTVHYQPEAHSAEVIPTTEPSTALAPQQSRPTISVSVAPHYTLEVREPYLNTDTVSALEQLGTPSPEQLNAAASMAMALYSAAEAKGFDVDIAVNAAPSITVKLDSGIQLDDSQILIDVDSTEKD